MKNKTTINTLLLIITLCVMLGVSAFNLHLSVQKDVGVGDCLITRAFKVTQVTGLNNDIYELSLTEVDNLTFGFKLTASEVYGMFDRDHVNYYFTRIDCVND